MRKREFPALELRNSNQQLARPYLPKSPRFKLKRHSQCGRSVAAVWPPGRPRSAGRAALVSLLCLPYCRCRCLKGISYIIWVEVVAFHHKPGNAFGHHLINGRLPTEPGLLWVVWQKFPHLNS